MAWIEGTNYVSNPGSGALGEPTDWLDVASAAIGSAREVDNSNARSVAMENAADDVIDQLQRAGITDHELVNPARVRRRIPNFDPFGVEQRPEDDPVAIFDRRRRELATRYADRFEVQQALRPDRPLL